jgi:hypothetical protein
VTSDEISLNMMSFDDIKFISKYCFASNFWGILSKNLAGHREKRTAWNLNVKLLPSQVGALTLLSLCKFMNW